MTAVRWRRWLAGAAALGGALAPLAGSPVRGPAPRRAPSDLELAALPSADAGAGVAASPDNSASAPARATPGSPSPIDVAELLRSIASEQDHVSAIELAGWIRAGRPGLRVIDLRSADEFAAYHIPRAEHVPIDRLASAPFSRDETIAVYSDRGVHGGQAWVLLRALGYRRVYFLRDGIHEWLDEVLHPSIAEDASAAPRDARAAELSRYFGGSPRTERDAAHTAAASPFTGRWRGC